jgi:hypothetical protein
MPNAKLAHKLQENVQHVTINSMLRLIKVPVLDAQMLVLKLVPLMSWIPALQMAIINPLLVLVLHALMIKP